MIQPIRPKPFGILKDIRKSGPVSEQFSYSKNRQQAIAEAARETSWFKEYQKQERLRREEEERRRQDRERMRRNAEIVRERKRKELEETLKRREEDKRKAAEHLKKDKEEYIKKHVYKDNGALPTAISRSL